MTLMSEVGQKAFDLGVPLAVHMDVTYRCNERCVHCYLDHDDHGEMTTAEIKDVLDQLGEALKSDALAGAKSIVLEGHADAKGNPAYNRVLSLKRAQSAKNFIASKHGIPEGKLKAVGKGSSEPIDPKNPEDAVNRRVRVIVNS